MFSKEVSEALNSYVYRLVDPRNGETFYVGVGVGNRVFKHASGKILSESGIEKLERIYQIQLTGLEVIHVIHRHGMSSSIAREVEAALIDAYPGLTNIVGGHGSNDFGPMNSKQIIERYMAREMEFAHKILLISVNRSAADEDLYLATQYAWKIDPKRAAKADYVVATLQGLAKGVFEVNEWLEATTDNFPGRETINGRYGFVGKHAPDEIKEYYIGAKTSEKYRQRGASNPIKYTY
ncbi:hypothetical protein MNBD_GAMMA02-1439 [hydrothermal vent metagenome]|uniref:GIY-YIG domain-containing protein n=1 Tax=hydrothermal vent metagenome TaxID=652676 RepID=A0A3B0VUA2_9ZZZZ